MPDGESQGWSSFRPNTTPAPASDSCMIDVLFLMSAGKLFHNFGPWTENALSKLVECDMGTCSKSRVVDLVWLSWWSETCMSNEEIYSEPCPEMLLHTVRQIWYWTRFGNGSQFSFLKSCSEGVTKSAFKIILAARFCSFTSLVRYYPKLHIQNPTLGEY